MRSSVLLTDSAVFVGTTNRVLIAFDARTGRRSWYQRLEGEISGDLVRSGRTLFMSTAEWNGRVHARDMERGKSVWRTDVGPTRFSPLLNSGLVYVATDRGYVHALRAQDGGQLWRVRIGGAAAATPLDVGDALIVATTTDTLYRIAKSNGALLLRRPLASTVSAAPALRGDTVVVATYAGAVLGVSALTLETLWRVDTGAPVLAAPAVASDGTIHVLNRDASIWQIVHGRGTKVATLGGTATGSFTLARDRYIIGLMDGTLLVTDLSGNVVAQDKFNDSVVAPVAVRQHALYVPLLRGRVIKLR